MGYGAVALSGRDNLHRLNKQFAIKGDKSLVIAIEIDSYTVCEGFKWDG